MKLTKTQKILLGTAITGVGGYFLYKYFFPADKESDQESEPEKKDADAGTGLVVLPNNTGVVPLPVIVPPKAPVPPTPKPPTLKNIKVDIADLLATNPNGAYMKPLYAGVNGLPIRNLNGIQTDVTKANNYSLGIITKVEKPSISSYKITFQSANGIKYYITHYQANPDWFYIKI